MGGFTFGFRIELDDLQQTYRNSVELYICTNHARNVTLFHKPVALKQRRKTKYRFKSLIKMHRNDFLCDAIKLLVAEANNTNLILSINFPCKLPQSLPLYPLIGAP